MSSDLVGSGIPILDYRTYAERIFFPGHKESPLRRDLDVQECRRATVEQGLVQLSNLLNSKLFLTKVWSTWPTWLLSLNQFDFSSTRSHKIKQKFHCPQMRLFFQSKQSQYPLSCPQFIHTLEGQRTFSPRDRAYVASLLTVALHSKLEYFTDILKTLLNDLVEQYTAKNPKLMLRR